MTFHATSGIYLNAVELLALEGEGAELFHLYVVGLRAAMDPETGLVGGRGMPFSYAVLKSRTMRIGRPGVGTVAHDPSKLRRMLARLVELGVVRKIADTPQRLEFLCVMADRADKNFGGISESSET